MPELNDRQSAEPNQCGSCQHYKSREPGDGYGLCTFRLPPFITMSDGFKMVATEAAILKRQQLEREICSLPHDSVLRANMLHTFSKLFMFLEEDIRFGLKKARKADAELVRSLSKEKPYQEQPWARMALFIAANAIDRGRLLTDAEKMENLATAFDEEGDHELAAKIRATR